MSRLTLTLPLAAAALLSAGAGCWFFSPTTLDGLLWDAFAGNRSLELVLAEHAERIPFMFCGHTHRARENTLRGIRGYNIGGDYHFKRMLVVDWPAGKVETFVFGDPNRRR